MENIKNHPVMKEVLADSIGGVLYNLDDQHKYDGKEKDELLALWDSLDVSEQNIMGGIIKGAIDFLKGN